MKSLTFAGVLLLTSLCLAATDGQQIGGAMAKPGYNSDYPNYINSLSDQQAIQLKNRYQAAYASFNSQIPTQAIIIGPANFESPMGAVSEYNVEAVGREFIKMAGLEPLNGRYELISHKFVLGKVWFVNYVRYINDIPVEGSALGMSISPAGKLITLWGNLNSQIIDPGVFLLSQDNGISSAQNGISGNIDQIEPLGKSILPLYFQDFVEYHPVYKYMIITNEPYAEWETYVDAENGEVLQRINKVKYDEISGTVGGSVQLGYPYDPWVDRNFFDMNIIFNGYDPLTTDSAGYYSFETPNSDPIDAYVYFRGPFLEVWNTAGEESEFHQTIDPPANVNIYWDDNNSSPVERDAWYSGTRVHQWMKRLDPELVVMDYAMNCNINIDDVCNAFWSGWTLDINFYRAGGGCNNTAQIADVVYHEYGHGVTDLQTRPLGPNGALHEGFSDYLACSMTNQPLVGLGFFVIRPNDPLRNLDNNNRYPDDWVGESHEDGKIIGGALWHTRQALSPYPMGYVDTLWHYARYSLAQEFEPYFWAFVALDDDDGDLTNGTPNALPIFYNFGDRHGIGPGTSLVISANTILDTEDSTRSFPVDATIESFFELQSDSVLLYFDNGTGYQPLQMSPNGDQWQAIIPAQAYNTHVNYYILAVNSAGFRGTAPDGAPEMHYSFMVGPDTIPPALALIEGPPNTIDLNGPYGPFAISAGDINGIDPYYVRLHYQINQEPERLATLSPDTGSSFILPSLDLSRRLFTGDTIHYFFTAIDGAHNPNTGRLPASGSYSLVMVTSEIFEDFEKYGMDRWSQDGDWIMRNDGFLSLHSVWYSSPNYPNNANSYFTMDFDYDLAAYPSARVTFYRKNLLRSGDTCFVEASNDGGFNWTRVGYMTGLVAPIFNQMHVDITSILRPDMHHYKIRFHFVSNAESTWVGVMLDDIGWEVDPAIDAIEGESVLPQQTELLQNFPNPFNPETKIQFTLAAESDVSLEIFDVLGRLVNKLYDGHLNSGGYSVSWNGRDDSANPVASGVYFYRLTTEQGVKQAKMTLLR